MARYQERFQGKKQVFLIRNGEAADAPAMMGYMSQVNRETTFLRNAAAGRMGPFPVPFKPSGPD